MARRCGFFISVFKNIFIESLKIDKFLTYYSKFIIVYFKRVPNLLKIKLRLLANKYMLKVNNSNPRNDVKYVQS